MQRGNLIIYDDNGKVWYQSGEAEGDVLPHEYPVGLPYMEIPFGTMATKRLISVDVTKEPHQPIFEEIPQQPSYEELQIIVEMMAEGVI